MKSTPHSSFEYHPYEEKLNIWSHVIGLILSIFGSVFMLRKAIGNENIWAIVSAVVFSVSMMMLYLASTLYHSAKNQKSRRYLQVFDHVSIYFLIAGTYTPFTLVTLHGKTGWMVFGFTWVFALVGVILKLFYTGRFNRISTLMYVLLGWNIVVAIVPLIDNLGMHGFYWLLSGGILYSVGAVFYMLHKVRYTHFIFHVFVVLGTLCHFLTVYWFVI